MRATRSSTTAIVKIDGVELVVHLVPVERRRHRRARRRAAPSRPTRSSCPRRSGSSRSARRAAAPSTIRSSRASGACARSRPRRARRTRACRRRSSGGRAARARGSPCRPRSSGTTRARARRAGSFRISATSIVCAHGTSGVGSRSKSTKSGRSGLSIREYHVFMSMQPMFTIQSSASSSLTTGKSIHFFVRARRASRRARGTSGSSPACAPARPSGRTPCRRRRRGSGAS